MAIEIHIKIDISDWVVNSPVYRVSVLKNRMRSLQAQEILKAEVHHCRLEQCSGLSLRTCELRVYFTELTTALKIHAVSYDIGVHSLRRFGTPSPNFPQSLLGHMTSAVRRKTAPDKLRGARCGFWDGIDCPCRDPEENRSAKGPRKIKKAKPPTIRPRVSSGVRE